MLASDTQKASVVDPPFIRATFADLDKQYSFTWGDTVKAAGKLLAGAAGVPLSAWPCPPS